MKWTLLMVAFLALSALGDVMLGTAGNGFFNNAADWGKVAVAASGAMLWEAVRGK